MVTISGANKGASGEGHISPNIDQTSGLVPGPIQGDSCSFSHATLCARWTGAQAKPLPDNEPHAKIGRCMLGRLTKLEQVVPTRESPIFGV